MSKNQPTSFRFPFTLPESVHPTLKKAIYYLFAGHKDVNDAIVALSPKVNANTTAISTFAGRFATVTASAAAAAAAAAANAGGIAALSGVHDEPLTDGQGNFIFAGGDIVVVTGVPT